MPALAYGYSCILCTPCLYMNYYRQEKKKGLDREGVGSQGSGFLNLPMWNVLLTGVGRTVKNSNIFFTETIVSGKDFVSLIPNTIRFSCQLGGEVLRALGLELEVETEGGDPPLSTVVSPDWDGHLAVGKAARIHETHAAEIQLIVQDRQTSNADL